MNNLNIVSNENYEKIIKSMIYEFNDLQIITDVDLSYLYGVETKRINEAVSRNKEKFPSRYAFRITEKEYNILKSQIATSKGGSRKGHMVFTESGIAMLSTVLRSPKAIKMSIHIIDAFVLMRKMINSNLVDQKLLYNQVLQNTQDIKLLQDSFNRLEEKPRTNIVFCDGQIFEARVKLTDIFNNAKTQLTIIDNYADITLLDIIKNLKVKVILITKGNILNKKDLEIYNKKYNNLNVIYNNTFHDRYFIIDNKNFYHCGHSINSIGKSVCQINLITDEIAYATLNKKINEILSN